MFAHAGVNYEKRRLNAPDDSFILGEWVGMTTDTVAVKLASGILVVLPRMVYTETDRHDVTESEGISVAYGNFHLKTMNYKKAETWAIGGSVSIEADIDSNGIGGLVALPTAMGTYWKVGIVRRPPTTDGSTPLLLEIYQNPEQIVIP